MKANRITEQDKIINLLNDIVYERKGTIVTVYGARPVKVRKGCEAPTKHTVFQLRIGHDYENQRSTMEARENGRERLGLDWAEHVSPCIIRHKVNGDLYLVGQPTGNKARSTYTMDGKRIGYNDAMVNALASEHSHPASGDWMSYKIGNIRSINRRKYSRKP